MLGTYLLVLALSIAHRRRDARSRCWRLSRTERLLTLFHVRGPQEKPRWGGVVFLVTFALTPPSRRPCRPTRANSSRRSRAASRACSPPRRSCSSSASSTTCGYVSPRFRSAVFIAGGIAAYIAGYRIDDVGLPWGPDLSFGPAGFVVTVFWVYASPTPSTSSRSRRRLGGRRRLRLRDDGAVAAHSDHPTVALLLVALAGAGLGFLPFNLPPASTYIGDSGAYVLGFVLGTLSIRAATGPDGPGVHRRAARRTRLPDPGCALAFDARLLHHQHPMIGDEDHIHHRLEALGAGPRGSLVVIYGLAALFSVGAILLH